MSRSLPKLSSSMMIGTLGGVGIVAALIIAASAYVAIHSLQSAEEEVAAVSHLQSNVSAVQDALLALGNAQETLLIASSTDEVASAEIQAARQALGNDIQQLSSSAEHFQSMTGISEQMAAAGDALVTENSALEKNTLALLGERANLDQKLQQLESLMGESQTRIEAISGKAYFASKLQQRSLMRSIKKAETSFDTSVLANLSASVNQVLNGTNDLIQECNKLRISILELSIIADQLSDVTNADQLTSLQKNKTLPTLAKAEKSLAALKEATEGNKKISALVDEQVAQFATITKIMGAGASSAFTLQGNYIASFEQQQQTLARFRNAQDQMVSAIDEVVTASDAIASTASVSAVKVGNRSNWMNFVIAGVVAFLLAAMSVLILRWSTKPLNTIQHAMHDIAQGDGDLTSRLPRANVREIDAISIAFNEFVEKVHNTLAQTVTTMQEVSKLTENTTNAAEESMAQVTLQNKELEMLEVRVNEMSKATREIAETASDVSGNADSANQNAIKGKQCVEEVTLAINALSSDIDRAAQSMVELTEDCQSVGQVLDVIRSIAEQTNLLALNAAIEAARAGEHGRGFSVVADEVRTLATRTQNSTSEIHEIVSKLQESANASSNLMQTGNQQIQSNVEHADTALNMLVDITQSIDTITGGSQVVASATEEQSAVNNEIGSNIINIRDASQRSAESAQQTQLVSQKLQGLTKQVSGLLGQFKI